MEKLKSHEINEPKTKRKKTEENRLQIKGKGGAATVYRALCKPLKETVAIKILDFDHEGPDKVAKEVRLMKLVDHVNVLKAHCAFVSSNDLWAVMPFMEAESFQHILKTAYISEAKSKQADSKEM
ncbi:hypothetical protein IFM89_000658 [Coptis chinensis]|uniref:Protein kinase domain-containing protein n=1 Tax=Coptis chinensis TaxID=261450 RepID=A0A835M900_9MAGN|nr:hypothetical protein IFM89_000658 [Coptis chinensis]